MNKQRALAYKNSTYFFLMGISDRFNDNFFDSRYVSWNTEQQAAYNNGRKYAKEKLNMILGEDR